MSDEDVKGDDILYIYKEYIKLSKVDVNSFEDLKKKFGMLIGKVVKDIAPDFVENSIELCLEDNEKIMYGSSGTESLLMPISGKSINNLIGHKIIHALHVYQEDPSYAITINYTTLEIITEKGSCFITFKGPGKGGIKLCR